MYRLFIDESGKNTLKKLNNIPAHFIIGGVLVHSLNSDFIKRRGDQIKFKYWGRTDVTLHGTNIRRLDGDFAIFADVIDPATKSVLVDNSAKRLDFYEDLVNYVRSSGFKFIWICVNKDAWIAKDHIIAEAITKNRPVTAFEKDLTKKVFEEVVKTYLCYLGKKKRAPGQIVVEASDLTQDGDILAIYNQFMIYGVPSMGLNITDVLELLTCISFATKRNRDHETQLADLGCYYLSLKARIEDSMPCDPLNQFEKDLIDAFENKAFVDACNALQPSSIRRL